jgi:predicted acylesterase/phospholipase RssA
MPPSRSVRAFVVAMMLAGCATGAPREPFTAGEADMAEVPGFPDVRYWADTASPTLLRATEKNLREEHRLPGRELNWLLLSGGGDDGAFGAGVLYGLSEAGRRPEYSLVAGVSTGALIAPFAFLGRAYDDQLRDVYTTIDRDDILRPRVFAGLLGADSLADTAPLQRLVARYVTPELLDAIAREHRAGRRLLVVTTHLDLQRPVAWSMGAIAQHGGPDAVELFRKVLVASASIPALFPPVMIEAAAGGRTIAEMHVDGGTTMQVFTVPMGLDKYAARVRASGRPRNIYIVMNTRLRPEFHLVERSTLPIAQRSLSTLTKSSGVESLRIYRDLARRTNTALNVAFIDRDFTETAPAPFDRGYMNDLFEYGRAKARAGAAWRKELGANEAGSPQ